MSRETARETCRGLVAEGLMGTGSVPPMASLAARTGLDIREVRGIFAEVLTETRRDPSPDPAPAPAPAPASAPAPAPAPAPAKRERRRPALGTKDMLRAEVARLRDENSRLRADIALIRKAVPLLMVVERDEVRCDCGMVDMTVEDSGG